MNYLKEATWQQLNKLMQIEEMHYYLKDLNQI